MSDQSKMSTTKLVYSKELAKEILAGWEEIDAKSKESETTTSYGAQRKEEQPCQPEYIAKYGLLGLGFWGL